MQRLLALLTWLAFPVYVWQGLGVRRRTTRMLPARGPVLHEVPGKAPPVALLVLGDPSAASVGIEQSEHGLAAQLAGLMAERTGSAVRWRAAGFNSATSGQIRDYVLPNLSADPWTHIVLAIGTNDTKNFHAVPRFKKEFGGLLYAIHPDIAYACVSGLYLIALAGIFLIGKVPQPPVETDRHPMARILDGFDLKDGKCVRLKLGDMATATVYNDDPAAQAKAFEDQGFEWLHVVDLNGAFKGESVNGAAIDAILKATKNPVQLGGGIRTLAHIESWLERGLARVILGTVAVRDPDLVKQACKAFPGKIAVGIDAKGGKVAVEGWAEASSLGVVELAKKFEGAGVAAIIYTDIDRDGVLAGINWDSTIGLAEGVSIPVIASGGLASLADIARMTMPDAQRLEGAISGRALYDGRIDAAEALVLLKKASVR